MLAKNSLEYKEVFDTHVYCRSVVYCLCMSTCLHVWYEIEIQILYRWWRSNWATDSTNWIL